MLKSGTVDASFTVPTITSDFGANHFIVSTDTTVPVPMTTPDRSLPGLYAETGEPLSHSGDGMAAATTAIRAVTGLTIAAGATLVLVDQGRGYGISSAYETTCWSTALLRATFLPTGASYIEANLIEVGSTGKITASATSPDNSGGEIYLGQGNGLTKTIINRGTIEAKGDGSGSGGYIYFEPDDLVVNYGTIDVSGGSAGGSGGEFDAYVDYGDFYSSGTVRMNGGNGDTGGDTEYNNENWYGYSCWIETAYQRQYEWQKRRHHHQRNLGSKGRRRRKRQRRQRWLYVLPDRWNGEHNGERLHVRQGRQREQVPREDLPAELILFQTLVNMAIRTRLRARSASPASMISAAETATRTAEAEATYRSLARASTPLAWDLMWNLSASPIWS